MDISMMKKEFTSALHSETHNHIEIILINCLSSITQASLVFMLMQTSAIRSKNLKTWLRRSWASSQELVVQVEDKLQNKWSLIEYHHFKQIFQRFLIKKKAKKKFSKCTMASIHLSLLFYSRKWINLTDF